MLVCMGLRACVRAALQHCLPACLGDRWRGSPSVAAESRVGVEAVEAPAALGATNAVVATVVGLAGVVVGSMVEEGHVGAPVAATSSAVAAATVAAATVAAASVNSKAKARG